MAAKRRKELKGNMEILTIIADYPETEDVFKQYDQQAGQCVLCNFLFESLESFASQFDIDLENLLDELNERIRLEQ